MNVLNKVTSSDELGVIAADARRELASTETRLSALLERSQEIAATAVKDHAELQRVKFDLEPGAELPYALVALRSAPCLRSRAGSGNLGG